MMVRMMEPQSEGIPIEVYCFAAVTAWTQYERIRGDVFDHLLSIRRRWACGYIRRRRART
ncbi:MAG: Small-conductance mechanosensitive channel [uncultured Caballeronia sp.]|nr:MAG: Small-conductance mechanosensitive channel [uncultured Caballeronia sp.]